jgi:hypothetical protein
VALSSPKISLQLSNVHNDDWLARLMLLVCETAQPGIEPGLIGELQHDLRAAGNLGCKRGRTGQIQRQAFGLPEVS